MNENIKLYNDDCFNVFSQLEKVDLILCDLPYGTLKNTVWDIKLDLNLMWENIENILNKDCNVVFFGSQPFTSELILSNKEWFKYELVWNKLAASNVHLSKKQPLKIHENILIFSNGKTKYNPQMIKGKFRKKGGGKKFGDLNIVPLSYENDLYYPKSIIEFSKANRNEFNFISAKPVSLLEYLITTYSNESEIVLDFTMGSGTTAIAALNTNRKFIGIEKDETIFQLAETNIRKYHNYEIQKTNNSN